MNTQSFKTLDKDAIYRAAPSVFAETAYSKVSDRYGFINTLSLIDSMETEGFLVTQAGQQRVKDEGKSPFTKHLLRFRHVDAKPVLDGVVPEILMFNSHDRSSGFSLDAGLFRFVCSNGLVVQLGAGFGSYRCRHNVHAVSDAIEGVYSVVQSLPEITAQVEGMAATVLSRPEQEALAESALMLRWDDGKAPVSVKQVLSPRREADRKTDVFTTLNALQENMIRGGLRGFNANGRRQRTRAVASINADTKLNKGLYALAQKMVELKATA